MKRVVGIGGVFFEARDPETLRAWYARHLGVVPPNEDAFEPSTARFMINYRVADLDGLVRALRTRGVPVDERIEEYPYGRFAWLSDPEGQPHRALGARAGR